MSYRITVGQIKVTPIKLFKAMRLLYRKFFSKKYSEAASFIIAERLAALTYKGYFFSAYPKAWMKDYAFLKQYKTLVGGDNYHCADRKFFLKNLLNSVVNVPGNLAECGVFNGASAWFICDFFKNANKLFFGFDSFEGLSQPKTMDGDFLTENLFSANASVATSRLADFHFATLHQGWIPNVFDDITKDLFCFVHMDTDLYQPTLDSLRFFYPLMAKGGIILEDDYGHLHCPGVRIAFDEFLKDKPEKLVEVPTGQAFFIKH